jgi:hypothetical protein
LTAAAIPSNTLEETRAEVRHRAGLIWSWDEPWSAKERFAFRWTFFFFFSHVLNGLLYPFPFSITRYISTWAAWLGPYRIASWFKELWPPCPGCDYDPMYWQAEFPWLALIALGCAVVWTVLDRKNQSYHRLHSLMRAGLRIILIEEMFRFGIAKLVGGQFWNLHGDAYLTAQPLGHWTGRALMWNTMGQSFAYASFTGIGEVVGGVLLLFRRTVGFGGALLAFVCGTVFLLDALMNRGGITGTALWGSLIGVVLFVPEVRRWRAFYYRNAFVSTMREPPLIPGRFGLVAKLFVVAVLLKGTTGWYLDPSNEFIHSPGGYWMIPHPLSGVFKVDSMVRNGQRVVPRFDDSTQWAYVGLGAEPNGRPEMTLRGTRTPATDLFVINPDGGIREGYAISFDTLKRVIAVDTAESVKPLMGHMKSHPGVVASPFTYEQPDKDRITLHAVISADTITAYLRRAPVNETTLFGSPRLVRSRYGFPLGWTR